jgi:hypothetical protein
MPPNPTSRKFFLIWSSRLRLGLPSGLFPSGFSHQYPVYAIRSAFYMPRPSHSRLSHPKNNIGWVHILMILCSFLLFSVTSSLLGSKFSSTPSAYIPPSMWATKFHTLKKTTGKLLVLFVLIFKFWDRKLEFEEANTVKFRMLCLK